MRPTNGRHLLHENSSPGNPQHSVFSVPICLNHLLPSLPPSPPSPPPTTDPVFGADLAKYCECKKVLVPQFLVQFMEHIEANGLDTVGLYRLSGNAASVQKLRCLVEQGT